LCSPEAKEGGRIELLTTDNQLAQTRDTNIATTTTRDYHRGSYWMQCNRDAAKLIIGIFGNGFKREFTGTAQSGVLL
jgi:hypothetical protein